MKKALKNFTIIIDLYETTKGEKDSAEHQESMNELKQKYVTFRGKHLTKIIEDMQKVRLITG